MENDDGFSVWNYSNGTGRPYFIRPPVVDSLDSTFVKENLHLDNGRLNRCMHRNGGGAEVMTVLDVRETGGLLSIFQRGSFVTIVIRFDILEIQFFNEQDHSVTLQGFQGQQEMFHEGIHLYRWWFDADTFITVRGDGQSLDRITTELEEYQLERRSLQRTEFMHVFPSLLDAHNNRAINVHNDGDPDSDLDASFDED